MFLSRRSSTIINYWQTEWKSHERTPIQYPFAAAQRAIRSKHHCTAVNNICVFHIHKTIHDLVYIYLHAPLMLPSSQISLSFQRIPLPLASLPIICPWNISSCGQIATTQLHTLQRHSHGTGEEDTKAFFLKDQYNFVGLMSFFSVPWSMMRYRKLGCDHGCVLVASGSEGPAPIVCPRFTQYQLAECHPLRLWWGVFPNTIVKWKVVLRVVLNNSF